MVRREHSDADPRTVQSLNVSLQWEVAPEGRERGLNGKKHLLCQKIKIWKRNLRNHQLFIVPVIESLLLSTGSDDSGISIEDADFEGRDTDHDSEDET